MAYGQTTPTENASNAHPLTLLEAVRSALTRHPQIRISQEQVEFSRGVVQQQMGAFDTTIGGSLTQSRVYTPLTPLALVTGDEFGIVAPITGEATNVTDFRASASKLFRNGISLTGTSLVDRDTDNFTDTEGNNISQFDIQLNVPLLRGRGRDVVDAQEMTAKIEVDASLFDLNQTVAQILWNTVSDYWRVVAAIREWQVASDSEARGRSFVSNTQALIDADEAPQNDRHAVQANLAGRTDMRLLAEQNLSAARQQLALDLGLSASEIPALGETTDDFPAAVSQPAIRTDPASVSTFISESLRRRADLLGVKRRSAEFSVQSKAAKNLLLPQLDLTVRTGYSGLRIGRSLGDYAIAPFQGVQGEDIIGGITFSFPPANHFARGQVIQTEASARQNLIRVGDTERSITAAVLTAVNDVAASRERLRSAGDSVEAFQRALQGERDKFSLGLNAIVDVLTIEDRLTQALTNQVNAQLSYALALVEFRFATGTIIDPNSQTHTIDRDTFVTLPQAILHYTSP